MEETPHEGKNDDAEIIVKEDEELKEGTNENIGHQEKNFVSKLQMQLVPNPPNNDFNVLILFV